MDFIQLDFYHSPNKTGWWILSFRNTFFDQLRNHQLLMTGLKRGVHYYFVSTMASVSWSHSYIRSNLLTQFRNETAMLSRQQLWTSWRCWVYSVTFLLRRSIIRKSPPLLLFFHPPLSRTQRRRLQYRTLYVTIYRIRKLFHGFFFLRGEYKLSRLLAGAGRVAFGCSGCRFGFWIWQAEFMYISVSCVFAVQLM